MATRSMHCTCRLTYQVPVYNPNSQSLHIVGNGLDVVRQKDKARIEFVARQTCHRELGSGRPTDGMQCDSVKPVQRAICINRYQYTEKDALNYPVAQA